ncbi:MAG: mandelate racemase/muconate lactonizing enzyme family protein [Acidobacteria bacterium]|nr:MAG: mandelate racemase/muconate lactonizing enzyme family protein [Acidobacteriota bacterium]
MKITKIESTPVRAANVDATANDGAQETIIVKIHTDEDIVGIGEVDASAWMIRAVLEAPSCHNWSLSFQEMLLGENPLDVERIWDKLYQGTIYTGRRGLVIHAIGAVDLALWDIAGKALGRPVYELLGGPRRGHVVPYASVHPRLSSLEETAHQVQHLMERVAELGYKAAKLQLVYGDIYTDADLVRLVRQARQILGAEMTFMIDVGYRWMDSKAAIRTIQQLEDCNLYFVETPLRMDDLDGHARLAQAVTTRIAGAELLASRWEALDLMDRGKVDVIQPDIGRAGGLTECLRIAKLASDRGLLCIPHGWKSGLTVAAEVHLSAAAENVPFIEYMVPELWPSVIRRELVQPEFAPLNGIIELPRAPGLGVELNEEVVTRLASGSKVARAS